MVDPKAPATNEPLPRFRLGETGYVGLKQISGYVYEELRSDLLWPKCLDTYKRMAFDPTISAADGIIGLMIDRVSWEFYVPENASAESKKAAEFLNFCMQNLDSGTWKDFISEAGSYRLYGFHIAEKVYSRIKDGKWEGKYKWSKLPTRSQDTIMKWIFSNDSRDLLGVRQTTRHLTHQNLLDTRGYVDIPRSKFIHFRYNAMRDDPEGRSPLKGAYIPWKFKTLIEEYEAIGVAKDMGGVPTIGVDVDFLARANQDPASSEAQVLEQLKRDAANMHAGDKNYIIIPLAYTDTGKPLFEFKLAGVEGKGKQYNTDDIIKRKQNEILMLYLADVLKLGTDSHGSFALADSKNALLGFAIDRHLEFISHTIISDLVIQTLELNGFNLSSEEIPQLRHSELDSVDTDVFSKLIQRAASVGYLPRTPELINEILQKSGFDYRVDDDISESAFEKLFPDSSSRAGDGMKTAGDGTSKSPSRDSSTSNKENT